MSDARRFELVIDGTTFFCLGFERAEDREAALSGGANASPPRGGDAWVPPWSRKPALPAEPRSRGRPSKDGVIAKALEQLGSALDLQAPLSDRARLILKHLAESEIPAHEIPKRRTVETYLAGLERRNSRKKGRRKSRKKPALA